MLAKPKEELKFNDYAIMGDMLRKLKCFYDINMKNEELTQISKLFSIVEVNAGDNVLDSGSLSNGYYIILIGKVSVQTPFNEKSIEEEETLTSFIEIANLEVGASFGELSGITGRKSTKLTAIEDSIFAVLPLDSYQQLLHKHKMKNIEQIAKFLLDIPYFQNCNRYSIYLTQYYFDMKNYIKGQNVCVAGNNLDYLYIVKDGEFEIKMIIQKKSEKAKRMVKRRGIKEDTLAKEGAKGLGRILKAREDEDLGYSNGVNSITPRDEILEISVRKIGRGEMFGQDDLLGDRTEYSATLRCVSLQAYVYRISKTDFDKWVRNLPGVNKYLKEETKENETRIAEFIKQYKRSKSTKKQQKAIKKMKRIRNTYLDTNNQTYDINILNSNSPKIISHQIPNFYSQNTSPINLSPRKSRINNQNIQEIYFPKGKVNTQSYKYNNKNELLQDRNEGLEENNHNYLYEHINRQKNHRNDQKLTLPSIKQGIKTLDIINIKSITKGSKYEDDEEYKNYYSKPKNTKSSNVLSPLDSILTTQNISYSSKTMDSRITYESSIADKAPKVKEDLSDNQINDNFYKNSLPVMNKIDNSTSLINLYSNIITPNGNKIRFITENEEIDLGNEDKDELYNNFAKNRRNQVGYRILYSKKDINTDRNSSSNVSPSKLNFPIKDKRFGGGFTRNSPTLANKRIKSLKLLNNKNSPNHQRKQFKGKFQAEELRLICDTIQLE